MRGVQVNNQDSVEQVWLPVIGRALAHLCMKSANLQDQRIVDQAKFLEALGLERKDAAAMLNTTTASISEMLRQDKQKKSKGSKNGKKKS